MDFYSIIAVVVGAVAVYFVWSRFFKAKPVVEESSLAPYKVEAPVAPEVEVAPVVETQPEAKSQQPELKVVSGNAASKPRASRKPRARKPATPKPAEPKTPKTKPTK